MSENQSAEHKHPDHEVVLKIATPKGPFTGEFEKANTVATVIAVVVEGKKLDQKDTYELVHDGKTLSPETNTLGSFGLHGTVKLVLVAKGEGV